MKHIPSLDSIEGRLKRARGQFMPLLGLDEQVSEVPFKGWHLPRLVEGLLNDRNRWSTTLPSFLEVQEWVEVHWSTERQTQPPAGTVSDGERWGPNGEVQLDAQTATCKLILAAIAHGVEAVAKYAKEFSVHGMIEVRSFYLLKGASVSSAEPLDDYCTLLPYREALQKVNADRQYPTLSSWDHWPPETTDNVCALETRSFERRGLDASDFERRVGPLLQPVPTLSNFEYGSPIYILTLILGLVWGNGLHIFGNWHGVRRPVAATLPYLHADSSRGEGTSQVLFPLLDSWPALTPRPINNAELTGLIDRYAALPEKPQHVLNLALRRLRDSTEIKGIEDKVIDLCIALEALFMEEGEEHDHKKLVSRRASWHFADSHSEREQIRTLLKEFYDYRNNIVHGRVPGNLTTEERDRRDSQLADVENVVRASLKTMIAEGRPQDWEDSKNFRLIRHNPPRAETEIPSVKSDSMSWTVKEQKEIDQVLEAVWKPEVDNAPSPEPDASPGSHHGIDAESIKRCRQQGIPYVISVPVRLYMAHPKWPKQAGEPVDERTKYYCGKDVERHLRRWQKAALDKKIYQFQLDLEEPAMYLPEYFSAWREILQRGGLPFTEEAS